MKPKAKPRSSHIGPDQTARMVDVSAKAETLRQATAEARVAVSPELAEAIRTGSVPKGPVLECARLAGIMAAKQTPSLIPLCHPLPLEHVQVDLQVGEAAVEIVATARTTYRTGVEMEAMVAAAVAALTVYDMCKSVDKGIVIERVRLLAKSGGKSGVWRREG
jgi:cyclic pyranopterin phosphate synthase